MTDSRKRWIGRILSALAVVFLAFDSSIKLMRLPVVLDATAQLGFPPSSIVLTGVVLLVCTLVYVIPRTSVVGAVLLTGYLGGAVAAQVRVGNPPFETVFPIIVGSVIWAGILVSDHQVRALLASR
jgi:sugar phosphate permease